MKFKPGDKVYLNKTGLRLEKRWCKDQGISSKDVGIVKFVIISKIVGFDLVEVEFNPNLTGGFDPKYLNKKRKTCNHPRTNLFK